MLEKAERAALVKSIATAIRGHVAEVLAVVVERMSALETQVRSIPAGPKGDPGESIVGPKGDPGESIKGDSGERGEPGTAGPQGVQGIQGERGATGNQGERGEIGPQGNVGEKGATGERGANGETGARGTDGRDALQIDILPAIPSKSVPRGTFALHAGGTLRAFRETRPLENETDLEKCGWEVVWNGFANIDIEQERNERSFTIRARMTNGGEHVKTFSMPVLIYREIFKEGTDYQRGDVVTYGGSSWHCQQDTQAKPGTSPDWRMMVREGRAGKEGAKGDTGLQGPAGRDGVR